MSILMVEAEWFRIQAKRFDGVTLDNCEYVTDILSPRIAHLFCTHCKGHLVACCNDRHYFGACTGPSKCKFDKELSE